MGASRVHWGGYRDTLLPSVRHLIDALERGMASVSLEPGGNVHILWKDVYNWVEGLYRIVYSPSGDIVQEVFARTHGDFQSSVTELTRQLTIHAKVAEAAVMSALIRQRRR